MTTPPDHWTPTALDGGIAALTARGRAAFAALDDGRVLRSDDGGAHWRDRGAPGPGPTALLVTPRALVLATLDGVFRAEGARPWQAAAGLPAVVLALAEAAGGLVAGTLGAGAFRSPDGARWTATSEGLPLDGAGLTVHALAAGAPGLVAGHVFGASRSADGGRRWLPGGVGLPVAAGPLALAAADGALYAGAGGRLYRTADGAAWLEVYDGPGAGRPLALLAAGGRAVFAADAAGALLRSTDGGASWESLGAPPAPAGALAVVPGWALAALADGALWRRPLAAPVPAAPPVEVALEPNDPNPFTEATDIAFSLSAPAEVVVSVHDLLDAEVARVAEGPFGAGRHRVRFAARTLPAGLYRCRLTAAGRSQARPMLLLR